MEGRIENALKITNRTQNILENLPEFATNWYYHLAASDLTESSIYEFINKFRNYLLSINKNTKEIKIEDLTVPATERYMITIQKKTTKDGRVVETSDSYKQSVWSALNSFFEYAVNTELITKNPMRHIKKSKNKDLQRINANRVLLTSKDFTKLKKAAIKQEESTFKNRNTAMMVLLMTTGMRRSALIEINVSQVDFERGIVEIIDKGDAYRPCPLTSDAAECLKIWIAEREELVKKYQLDTDALFISAQGRITSGGLYKIVKQISRDAFGKEREIAPHKIRSGYISILYNSSHDAEFVRRAVGHSNIATTERYIVPEEDVNEKSKNIMERIFK